MSAPPITERHLPHFHRRAPMKEAVRAATTANITISTALNNGDSLDGLTLATGDRVLVKDQSTGSQNGIYVVGVTPVRDYDESTDDPSFGYLVFVREGTANGGTLWKNTNTSAPTIDTTALTFAQFTSGGLTDPMTTRGDIIIRNASNVTARLGKGAADTFLHSDGTDVGYAAVTDAMLSTSDITTNNVSTTKHGFAPKAPNDATKYLDGTGAYSVPASGGGGSSSDAVTAQSGAGGVIWHGIQASADQPPASPNGSDDEFDTTDTSDPMTGWTTLQTPTTHDINSTFKSHYYVKKSASNATTANVGIYKAWSPSGGSTVSCRMSDAVQSGVSFMRAGGLFIGESPPGKMMFLTIVQDGSGPRPAVISQSAPGTFISTPGTFGNIGYYLPIVFRIVYTSSTSISYYFSQWGRLWTPVLLAHNPGFTVGVAGLCIDPANASQDGEAMFDWIMFT